VIKNIFNSIPYRFEIFDNWTASVVDEEMTIKFGLSNLGSTHPLVPGLSTTIVLQRKFKLAATITSNSPAFTKDLGIHIGKGLKGQQGEFSLSFMGRMNLGKTSLANGISENLADTLIEQKEGMTNPPHQKPEILYKILTDSNTSRHVRHADAALLRRRKELVPDSPANAMTIVNMIEHPNSYQLLNSSAAFVITLPHEEVGKAYQTTNQTSPERTIQVWVNKKNSKIDNMPTILAPYL
jgi:hypothetical protein